MSADRRTTEHPPVGDLVGSVIDDRYRLEECLGEGGMGVVYRATQTAVNRQVALKLLKPELCHDREHVQRFHREARAVARLGHPNTIRLYDFRGAEDGLVYIVTELLTGETLGDRLWRVRRMHPAKALKVAIAILGSLEEAHAAGLIHRDLKPDNIFLLDDEHETVKVLDFGLVKLFRDADGLGQLTQSGVIGGTPKYTSPENAEGMELDPRSDIYSLGVLIFEMIVGEPPFIDEMAVELLMKHIEEPAPPLAVPGVELPAALVAAVECCLEKKPKRRFRDALELRETLEAILPLVEELEMPEPPPRKKRQGSPTPAHLSPDASLTTTAGGSHFWMLFAAAVALAVTLIALVLLQ